MNNNESDRRRFIKEGVALASFAAVGGIKPIDFILTPFPGGMDGHHNYILPWKIGRDGNVKMGFA
jgi:hypothetical protein